MLSSEELKEWKDIVAPYDNETLGGVIAYLQWMETNDPTYWQKELGDDYTPEDITDIKIFLWQEASRRGISVSDVQSKIYVIAQGTVDRKEREAMVRKALLYKKKNINNNKIITNIIWAIVIITAIFLLYKYVFKGKLGVA